MKPEQSGTTDAKPRVFIGSAGESKTVAHKIFTGIEDFAEAVVWTRAFRPGDYTLEAIVEKLALSDFGVFVFTPDDVADIRKRRFKVIRLKSSAITSFSNLDCLSVVSVVRDVSRSFHVAWINFICRLISWALRSQRMIRIEATAIFPKH